MKIPRKILLYAGFLLALVIAVEPEIEELLTKTSSTVPPPFYSYRVRHSMKGNAYAQGIAIITLTPGVEPQDIFFDHCSMLEFLGKTIFRVQKVNPGLIVILRSFPVESCPPGSERTTMLLDAVITASRLAPLVIGANTKASASQDEPERSSTEDAKSPGEPETASLRLLPRLGLGEVNFGILGLNRDNRRIPVFRACQSAVDANPHQCLGIAAEVARTRDPRIFRHLNIISFLAGEPFSSFLAPASIPTVPATALLCGDEGTEGTCQGTQKLAELLRRRIVIIADYSKPVVRNEFMGEVQEAVLQASYIDSLLEGKLHRPIKVLPFLVIYAAWIVFMQASFWKSKSPTRTFVIFGLIWLGFSWPCQPWDTFSTSGRELQVWRPLQ